MGTVGLGRVLELWLLGPDVVVEPGEKLADTRAAKKEKVSCSLIAKKGQEWLISKTDTKKMIYVTAGMDKKKKNKQPEKSPFPTGPLLH